MLCSQYWSTNYFQMQVAGTPQINEVWSLSFTEGAASTQRHSQQDRNPTCRKFQNTAETSHWSGIVLSLPSGHLFGQSQLCICNSSSIPVLETHEYSISWGLSNNHGSCHSASLSVTFTLHRDGRDHRDPRDRIVLLVLGALFLCLNIGEADNAWKCRSYVT